MGQDPIIDMIYEKIKEMKLKVKEEYEIEGRVIFYFDNENVKSRVYSELIKKIPGKEMKTYLISDYYFDDKLRIREIVELSDRYKNKSSIYLNKKVKEAKSKGKYGILVNKETNYINSISESEKINLLSYGYERIINGGRVIKKDKTSNFPLSLCIDNIFNPEIYGVEYEIVLKNENNIDKAVKELEEYYENILKRIFEELKNKYNFDYKEEYRNYYEIIKSMDR